MLARRFYACPVCSEEFVLPARAVRLHLRAVICPCCGDYDVIDLGEGAGFAEGAMISQDPQPTAFCTGGPDAFRDPATVASQLNAIEP